MLSLENHGMFLPQSHTAIIDRRKTIAWGTRAVQSARDFVVKREHLDVVSKLKSFWNSAKVC